LNRARAGKRLKIKPLRAKQPPGSAPSVAGAIILKAERTFQRRFAPWRMKTACPAII